MPPNNALDRYLKAVIALILLLGFFGVLAFQMYKDQAPELMIGALITSLASAIGYYFGTTSGDARKTELLAQSGPAQPVETPK